MKRLTALCAVLLLLIFCGTAHAQQAARAFVWSASWCAPCKQYAPIVEQAQRAGYAVVVKDYDAERDIATKQGVQAVPTTIFTDIEFREVGRITGALSYEQLTERLILPSQWRPAAPRPRTESPPGSSSDNPIYPPAREGSALQRAVVRVYAQGQGGSGVVVGSQAGRALVLTNDHVVQDQGNGYSGDYRVVYADGTAYRATLIDHSKQYDIAGLVIETGFDVPYIPMAEREATPGETLYMLGYGGGWREVVCTAHGIDEQPVDRGGDVVVTPCSVPGDSGGPIVRIVGDWAEVVGIVWGGRLVRAGGPPKDTRAVRPTNIEKWVANREGVWQRIFACKPGCGCRIAAPQPIRQPPASGGEVSAPPLPKQVPQQPIQQPPQLIDPEGGVSAEIKAEIAAVVAAEISKLKDECPCPKDLEAKLTAALEAKIKAAIDGLPAGPPGPPGPPGERGPPGKDGSNEPIWFQVVDEGQEYSTGPTPVRPGELFTIYLDPTPAERIKNLEKAVEQLLGEIERLKRQ